MTTDLTTIRSILDGDPIWAAYALADLQPDFAPYCRWYVAGDKRGLALIYTGLSIPTLYTFGPAESVAETIACIDLPERVYITVREEHYPQVERYYDFSADYRPMWRMAMSSDVMVEMADDRRLVRLAVDDSERLRDLYRHGGAFTPDAFDPYQVENGVFFGVVGNDGNGDGELVAAGGTHIVDWAFGVAAIGNMYTRPDQRRRGHAVQIVRAIVATLQGANVQNIVLNVDQRNQSACSLYERFGFIMYCPYVEGIGEIREDVKT